MAIEHLLPDTLATSHQRGDSRAAKRRRAMVRTQTNIRVAASFVLPEPAYDLWVRGELLEAMHIRDDGRTRVEIIGGEIVVSPAPLLPHGLVASDIHDAIALARVGKPTFPWRAIQAVNFNVEGIAEGYIPDLIVAAATEIEAVPGNALYLTARQVAMVIEITSKSTAARDRRPGPRRLKLTKWSGYARERVPYYLLVDRDPKAATSILFSEPDSESGEYQATAEWPFGETIALPEPFDIKIPTDTWSSWED
jgi:Uma2 family endonuclease